MLRLSCFLSIIVCITACSRSNNLLLGRVESVVGGHTVAVTDCYRTSVAPPQELDEASYRFTPCRDADVRIRNEDLTVNGQSYGKLKPNDSVLVDHGVVWIRHYDSLSAASR